MKIENKQALKLHVNKPKPFLNRDDQPKMIITGNEK